MKTFKLTKGIQITLVTLLVLIAGMVIVGLISNNHVSAATKACPNCAMGGTMHITYKDRFRTYLDL